MQQNNNKNVTDITIQQKHKQIKQSDIQTTTEQQHNNKTIKQQQQQLKLRDIQLESEGAIFYQIHKIKFKQIPIIVKLQAKS